MARKKAKEKNEITKEEIKVEQVLDLIGRQKFVDKIKKLVEISSLNKSWSIAINGSWGSGKTFVMNMLEKDLKEDSENIVIYYDAWSNDFYEDPLIAILYNILDVFNKFGIKQVIKDGIVKGIKGFGAILCSLPEIGNLVSGGIKAFKEITSKPKKSTEKEGLKEFKSYSQLIKETQLLIENAIEEKRLIILVDELDRCEVDYAMKVLNRLHHLLKIPNVFTITALNKEIIENSLWYNFNKEDKSKFDTFKKFFDITYTLPQTGDNGNEYAIIEQQLMNTFANSTKENLTPALIFIDSEINKNPRDIERLFETCNFIFKNLSLEKQNISYFMFIVWCYIYKNKINSFFNNFILNKEIANQFTRLIDISYNTQGIFRDKFIRFLRDEINYDTPIGESKITTYKNYDNQLKTFFVLINMLKCFKIKNKYLDFKRWYNIKVDESDYNEINNIIELIKILEE